jgi:glutamyl-tRNA synthetase
MIKDFDKKIKAYALKNAISHEGKAQQGSVISSLFHEGLKPEDVKKYVKDISKVVNQINSLSVEEQQKEFEKLEKLTSERETREGLEELPEAEKGVVMRFRPSPSGPLHVGHLVSNMISSLYVKKYGGKFYVIIDDTDPETVSKEAYDDIKKDCDWAFGNVYQYLNSSDRMELYYKYAEELIDKKAAYVCTCSSERFKKYSEAMEDCPCRNISVEDNVKRWRMMMDKKGYKEGQAVLRFKSFNGMKDKNPAMRDFPLARINLKKHPKQGNKYRVWPLMNLAVAVDDMELKMTHIIRGKDHMDNAERQKMIFKIFGKKYPFAFFIGRIKFKDLALSKRKITAAIKEGKYESFEDKRLPTLVSLRKRGYKPEAFAKFVEQRGITEVDKVMDSKEFFQIIDNFNKSVS